MSRITVRDCRLIFRPHFGGHADIYNTEGDRNFRILVSEEQAEILSREGFNIKWTKETEDHPSEPTLKVKISYRFSKPLIKVHNGKKFIEYDESMLDILDGARINNCHVTVSLSRTGGTYLVTGIFYLDVDELAMEFGEESDDLPFDV